MIKNIIFDLGNVVLGFNCFQAIKDNCKEGDFDKFADLIFKSDTWKEYDNGEYTKDTVTEEFLSKVSSIEDKEVIKKVMDNWTNNTYLPTYEVMTDFIKTVRDAGYKTFILSNTPFEVPELLKKRDLLKLFDGVIYSCDLHISKPDLGIYKELLNKYNLVAEECIFLDDRQDNIEAANSIGIHGIVYEHDNHDKIVSQMKEEYDLKF